MREKLDEALYDRRIIEDQLQKYYGYVEKGHNNKVYSYAKKVLNEFTDSFESNKKVNIKSVLIEMINIFNMLDEYGFPMGRAKYPGPSAEWKELVDKYLD